MLKGYKLLSSTIELANELCAQINAKGAFQVLELSELLPDELKHDIILLDPSKVTIDISRCGFTIEELIKELS